MSFKKMTARAAAAIDARNPKADAPPPVPGAPETQGKTRSEAVPTPPERPEESAS